MSAASNLIALIEQIFAELRKEYTLFLSDQVKVEPYEKKEMLRTKMKQLRNLSNLRTEEQFRANNLIAKVQSHLQLWERQLERKYQGKGRPKPKPKAMAPQAKPREPERKTVVISDAGKQREQVVALYDEYTRLNLLLGARKMIQFSKFQNFIKTQTSKIQSAKGSDKVRYEVVAQDGKVVIKSRTIK